MGETVKFAPNRAQMKMEDRDYVPTISAAEQAARNRGRVAMDQPPEPPPVTPPLPPPTPVTPPPPVWVGLKTGDVSPYKLLEAALEYLRAHGEAQSVEISNHLFGQTQRSFSNPIGRLLSTHAEQHGGLKRVYDRQKTTIWRWAPNEPPSSPAPVRVLVRGPRATTVAVAKEREAVAEKLAVIQAELTDIRLALAAIQELALGVVESNEQLKQLVAKPKTLMIV